MHTLTAPTVLDTLTVTGADLPPLAYAHRVNTFDSTRVDEARNCHFTKPTGGAWLSPVSEDGSTRWQGYLNMMDQPVHVVTSVALRPDARVLRIDTLADLAAIVAAYPPPPALHESIANMRGFDFEAAARDFDAVWLTNHGVNVTHRIAVPNLAGWDVESVLILTASAVA